MRSSGPGGPGRLPARGSHRPERAQLTHSVPQVIPSLLAGTRSGSHTGRASVFSRVLASSSSRSSDGFFGSFAILLNSPFSVCKSALALMIPEMRRRTDTSPWPRQINRLAVLPPNHRFTGMIGVRVARGGHPHTSCEGHGRRQKV